MTGLPTLAAALATMVATTPPGAVPPTPDGVTLHGLSGQTQVLTTSDIGKLPHVRVSLSHAGKTTVYEGPLISDMLRDLSAPMGVRFHGEAVDDVLWVKGRDGYRVVLSLGEVDPAVHAGAKVILADRADGQPLDAHEGPFRLVIDNDLKPARSAKQVVEIDLQHLN